MLTFDKDTGFAVTETTDVREEIAQQWKDAFKKQGAAELNTEPETPAGQIIDSQTAAVAQKDAEVAYLANQFNPLTASGIYQDALGKIYFLERKAAINSTAVCTLVGRTGTVIPAGAQIRSNDEEVSAQTVWTLESSITIGSSGAATATFTCEDEGAIAAGENTLTKIVNVVAGWDSVTNPAAATVGQLEETQSAFEARRYQSVALNARGTTDAVYARVANVNDVIAVYVTDNKTNVNKTIDGYTLKPHSIYVAATGGTDADIAKAIYNSVSAGCDYNGNTTVQVINENTGAYESVQFERPADYPIYFKVKVQHVDLPTDYTTVIAQAIYNNFFGADETIVNSSQLLRLKMNDNIYASRFSISIMNAGILSVLSIELSTDGENWVNSVHVPIDKNPTMALSNVTVVLDTDEEEGTGGDEGDSGTGDTGGEQGGTEEGGSDTGSTDQGTSEGDGNTDSTIEETTAE